MDSAAIQAAVVFFVFALPFSVAAWTLLVSCAGILRPSDRAPGWYSFLASRLRPGRTDRLLGGVFWSGVFVGFSNFAPLVTLVAAPSLELVLVDLIFLAVEALLVGPLLRAAWVAWSRGRRT